jgi:alkanesulfonate monooxygenase SsuD/methylene tetrahydromethanopterin reductase-like flavin-dependent oxidoreductase (luciferase family)
MEELKFGIFDHLDRGGRSMSDLYEQRLQIVEQYDRAGFYAYHLAEHHSTPLGMAPSPSVFLSAVAQRTKALRFGPLVYLLPLYHPLQTDRDAQELAARAYPVWHASFFELFRRYGQKPVQVWPARFDEMAASGLAFAGSPLTLTRALSAQLQAIGSNYLVGQFVFGDMSLAESAKSVELFASRVMPTLVHAHRTERQAAAARG